MLQYFPRNVMAEFIFLLKIMMAPIKYDLNKNKNIFRF